MSRVSFFCQFGNKFHLFNCLTYLSSNICVISVKTVKNDQHYYTELSYLKNKILMKHDNIRNQICSCMYVFFVNIEEEKNNLASNTNHFTPLENNILLWVFPLNGMQANLPFLPSPLPIPLALKKFQKCLE